MDAILSVPRTRAMYVRRLRSLMDQFIATGRLEVSRTRGAGIGAGVWCGEEKALLFL